MHTFLNKITASTLIRWSRSAQTFITFYSEPNEVYTPSPSLQSSLSLVLCPPPHLLISTPTAILCYPAPLFASHPWDSWFLADSQHAASLQSNVPDFPAFNGPWEVMYFLLLFASQKWRQRRSHHTLNLYMFMRKTMVRDQSCCK